MTEAEEAVVVLLDGKGVDGATRSELVGELGPQLVPWNDELERKSVVSGAITSLLDIGMIVQDSNSGLFFRPKAFRQANP